MVSDLGIEGFDYATVEAGHSTYRLGIAGEGPAVLLLHGFPQYHYCWHRVAPALSMEHTVIVCDLKGCGGSRASEGGPLGEGYSKREIAAELVGAMKHARGSITSRSSDTTAAAGWPTGWHSTTPPRLGG